jgi:NADPH-dependent dioxygenase
MNNDIDDIDVLVVGAGPVGLMAAGELLRHGARVRLIEALPGPTETSRALATHGRTLEVYDQIGVLDQILERGQPCTAFVRHTEGAEPVRYDFGYSDDPIRYEYNLMIDQRLTEQVLRDHLHELGGRIEWNTRLEATEPGPDHVRCRTTGPDGAESTFEVPWLVACDGAHSIVRKSLGIPLRGASTKTWLVADAEVHADLDRNAGHLLFGDGGASLMFAYPSRGRWRVIDMTHARHGEDTATVIPRLQRRLSAATGQQIVIGVPSWMSIFTIQQRAVPTMRSGRCFLAGDAAHVHSPAGGQGMNTGLQDAFNLAWKLAAVTTGNAVGDATEPLLDSYSLERVPIGQALLESTALITDYVMNADNALHTSATFADTGREIIGRVQATAITYHDSPLTTPATGDALPRPGERVTRVDAKRATDPVWRTLLAHLRRPGWTLLLLRTPTGPDGPHPQPLHTLRLDDPTLAADLGAPQGGWLLVRPDGYTAARGTHGTAPAGTDA